MHTTFAQHNGFNEKTPVSIYDKSHKQFVTQSAIVIRQKMPSFERSRVVRYRAQ